MISMALKIASYYFVEGTKSLSSQIISTRETKTVRQAGLSLQRKRHLACFLTKRLRMDMVKSLVTSELSI